MRADESGARDPEQMRENVRIFDVKRATDSGIR